MRAIEGYYIATRRMDNSPELSQALLHPHHKGSGDAVVRRIVVVIVQL